MSYIVASLPPIKCKEAAAEMLFDAALQNSEPKRQVE